MKNSPMYLILTFLFCSHSILGQINTSKKSTPSQSQSPTTYFEDVHIKLDNTTESQEIVIPIQEQTPILNLMISSTITLGKVNITVINPQELVIGKFAVKAKDADKTKKSFGELNKFLKNPKSGDWKIIISTNNATGKIFAKADFEKDYFIKAPIVFTPIVDGKPNYLIAETHNISETEGYSFTVYNMFGEVVFFTKNINEGWDGKVDNKLQEPSPYYYTIEATTNSGQEVSFTGKTLLQN